MHDMIESEDDAPKLHELMEKFRSIGKNDYSGKVYDNVMSIFDELTLEEQKQFLRGCLGMYIASSSPIIHNKTLIDTGNLIDLLLQVCFIRNNPELMGIAVPVKPKKNKPEPPSGMKDSDTVKFAGALVVFFFIIHLLWLAVTDDPSSEKSFGMYKRLFDVVQVFSK